MYGITLRLLLGIFPSPNNLFNWEIWRYCSSESILFSSNNHHNFLQGNRFIIALRNVIGNESQILANLESLKEVGFINYYGSQRFGTRHVPTHYIGKQLILGRWQKVIRLVRCFSDLRIHLKCFTGHWFNFGATRVERQISTRFRPHTSAYRVQIHKGRS